MVLNTQVDELQQLLELKLELELELLELELGLVLGPEQPEFRTLRQG